MLNYSQLIEWIEPHDADAQQTLICRMTVRDAIEAYRKRVEDKTDKAIIDEHLLESFMAVHWARFVEDKE